MNLSVNGESIFLQQAPNPSTLAKVIDCLGHHPQQVVVEFNGEILVPQRWETQIVKDGDSLEIVTIVGGGS